MFKMLKEYNLKRQIERCKASENRFYFCKNYEDEQRELRKTMHIKWKRKTDGYYTKAARLHEPFYCISSEDLKRMENY